MGKEIEALEHHADLAAQATQVAGPVGDGRPADGNFALLPLLQTVQAAQQSRLSGPGRAAEHCAAAGLHVQRNAVERTPGAVPLAEGPRSEERRVGKEGVSTCRSRWSPYH